MTYWLMNTAGIGSIIVFAVGLSVLAAYFYMVRWIQTAPPEPAPSAAEADPEAQAETLAATEAGGE